jgi:hypothetical protein
MSPFCKYKNLFGELNTGIHKYKLFGVSVPDVLITILIAYGISSIFKTPFLITLGLLFIIGIIVHRLFCVRTTVDKLLFPNIE